MRDLKGKPPKAIKGWIVQRDIDFLIPGMPQLKEGETIYKTDDKYKQLSQYGCLDEMLKDKECFRETYKYE